MKEDFSLFYLQQDVPGLMSPTAGSNGDNEWNNSIEQWNANENSHWYVKCGLE